MYFRCDYWSFQYPNSLLGRQAVLDRAIPFWEPYSGLGGRPAMAEPVRGYAYLPNVVTFAVGTLFSEEAYQRLWILRVLLHVAAGGVGVHLLIRRWGFGRAAGVFAAIVFCFAAIQQASVHMANFTDGFALFPWILLVALGLTTSFSWVRFLALAFVVSQLLCGAYQNLYLYAALMVGLYLVVESAERGEGLRVFAADAGRKVAVVAAAFMAGAFLALFQILPTLRVIEDSYRVGVRGLEWSTAYQRLPYQVFQLFWPSFFTEAPTIQVLWKFQNVSLYVGLLPLFLLPLLFVTGDSGRHRTMGTRWLLIALPFAMLTFGGETRLHDLLYLTVPLYGYFRASNNAWVVTTLAIAIVSGISLGHVLAGARERLPGYTRSLIVTGLVVAVVAAVVFIPVAFIYATGRQVQALGRLTGPDPYEHVLGAIGRFLFWWALAFGGLLAARAQPRLAAIALSLAVFFDLSSNLGAKLLCNHSPVNPAIVFGPNRVIDGLKARLAAETGPARVRFAADLPQHFVAEHYKIFTDYGATTVTTRQDAEVAFLTDGPVRPFANIAYEVSYAPMEGRTPVEVITVTADEEARAVFASLGAPDGPGLSARRAGDKIFIYRTETVLPRAYFIGTVRVIDGEAIAQEFNRADLATTALVRRADLPASVGTHRYEAAGNRVVGLRYRANDVSIDVEAPRDGILVSSDTYAAGWRAYAGDQALPLFRVNGKFRAIAVPAGTRTISLRYSAPGFRLGTAISLVTFSVIGALIALERTRRRRTRG